MADLLAYEQKQHPWFRSMRARTPVHFREKEDTWELFCYDDVLDVLSEPELFSSDFRRKGYSDQRLGATMISSDPPVHSQLRGLVARDFTPRAVAQLAPRITAIAHELLDRVARAGSMDVVTDFADPLPVIVIAEMLGIPPQERARFKAWSDTLIGGSFEERRRARRMGVHDAAAVAVDEMADYFEQKIAQRRRQPEEDLISKLVEAQLGDGRKLSQNELLGFCILLLVAGNITTTNLISNAVICFDEHPGVIERLRAEPKLLPSAIEEVLRYRSPARFVVRRAAASTRLRDEEIQADQMIIAWLHSANFDEQHFPEPERFDIERAPNRHLAFGYDIHFCLGAHLARLESRIALEALLERLPDIRRVPDSPLEMVDSAIIYGVKHVPVTFTPAGSFSTPTAPAGSW